MRIALVDYGAGNLPSVERALRRLSAEPTRAADPAALAAAETIILPGVGHFGAMIRTLDERRLLAPLRSALAGGVPFLGICLGLQALFESSEEDPARPGLGFLPGRIQPLPVTAKIPHMGWNQVKRLRESVLLRGIASDAYFYFAHSYAALDLDSAVAVCEHGAPFVAVLEQGNAFAIQFHPEKSGDPGARILANFLEHTR